MFWLTRPPLLRYAGAALLVAAGFAVELWPQATVSHPFTTIEVRAGQIVDASSVEYHDVPRGLLPPVELPSAAAVNIGRGDPITPSLLASGEIGVPDGWWSIEMPVPERSRAGTSVLVVTGTGERVEGMIVAVAPADDFTGTTGLVAVHPDGAQAVALAVLARDAAVLLGH